MRRRGTLWPLSSALLALLLPACASGPAAERATAPRAQHEQSGAPGQVEALHGALENAERQVRELEARLADRDREVASVRAEVEKQRAREQQASRALEELQRVTQTHTAEATTSPADDLPAAGTSPAAAATAAEAAASVSGEDPQIIASLRAHLEQERAKRRQLESDLVSLQQETAAGPFENGPTRALREARDEIAKLKVTLEAERRARENLARRYAALEEKVRSVGERPPEAAASEPEEIAALRARQEKALAGIRRELAASQQREQELRLTLQTTQGPDAISLAEAISGVRSENSALQVRLDEEHQRNRELSAKLKLAMRVTDLIFKMQAARSAAAVAPEALSP